VRGIVVIKRDAYGDSLESSSLRHGVGEVRGGYESIGTPQMLNLSSEKGPTYSRQELPIGVAVPLGHRVVEKRRPNTPICQAQSGVSD
jgi:hypothetical protein